MIQKGVRMYKYDFSVGIVREDKEVSGRGNGSGYKSFSRWRIVHAKRTIKVFLGFLIEFGFHQWQNWRMKFYRKLIIQGIQSIQGVPRCIEI